MNSLLKRVMAGLVAAILAAIGAPLLTATPAFALGSLQGAATIKTAGGGADLQSGDSATDWTLRLPSGASCPGDSPNDGWRWQTYMVPSSVDPATLTFGSVGPEPPGVGASFRQPLFTVTGDPVVNQQTPAAATAGGPGPIINIPDVDFQVFSPGDIPAGVYNIGIACTLGGSSSTQMSNFWNVQMTVSTDAADTGPAGITWENGTLPAAPTAGAATSGDGQLTVTFTGPAGANPPVTQYTATATPSGGGTAVTATGAASPITVTGLTNLTSYDVTVRATNSVGDSPESNQVSGTPGKPAVSGLTATPSPNAVDLDWNDVTGSPTFTVDHCTDPGVNSHCDTGDAGFATTSTATSSASIGGLTPGTLYTFTVYYPESFKASTTATPLSDSILVQEVSATRPGGALVLTQVCGRYGALPEEGPSTGFPGGFTAEAATTGGTAPTLGDGSPDPNFPDYPNPADPNYPTHCSLDLGTAQLVTSGTGAGQFFAASGRLNQVTVVDTRDTDTVWTVNFQMGQFSDVTDTKHFSGNQLGWTNTSTDTGPFTDGEGNPYDQDVDDDAPVAPNTSGAGGAGTSQAVAHCAADGSCLGIATIDARIKLLIPIHALSGDYTGQLTITAA